MNAWRPLRLWTLALGLSGLLGLSPTMPVQAETVPEITFEIGNGLSYLPIMVAMSEGYFNAAARDSGLAGLNVKIIRINIGSAVIDALLTGAVDIASAGSTTFIVAWDKTFGNYDLRGISGINFSPFKLITARSEVKTLKDIGEHDRIAVAGIVSPQAVILRMAADQAFGPGGYSRFDSRMVVLSHPDSVAAMLAGGEVNTYIGTPPYTDFLLKNPRMRQLTTGRDAFDGPVPGVLAVATQRFVDANPKIVQAVIATLARSDAFIAANRRRAAEIYIAAEPQQKMGVSDIETLLQDPDGGYSTVPSGFGKLADFMARTGMIKRKPSTWRDLFVGPIVETGGS